MKNKNPRGFFDDQFRLEKLSKQGDPLVQLKNLIDWEQFRPILNAVFESKEKDPEKGGRPPYNYIVMFKILIMQRYYNLSDDQMEYQINDRLSFMRFLDLEISDRVPDSKTIWLFRENLTVTGAVEELFKKFDSQLREKGYIGKEGKIIDASFVEVPKQRNNREENLKIKTREIPEQWEDDPHKLSQKDTDARWTVKNKKNYFGYKNHVKVDNESKLIESYEVTDASVHDSQVLELLLDESDKSQPLYADSAYTGESCETAIKKNKMKNRVIEKGYKNKPLTEKQIAKNKKKSKIRVRVEHVFGFVENSMNSSFIRSIGIIRAKSNIGLMNLTYNICRYTQLKMVVSMG